MNRNTTKDSAWLWVPSLYFAEGLPLIVISAVSVIMYKKLGIPNSDIALFTSWLYLPWVIKGIWSPLADIFGRKRSWIIATQLLMGAGFACLGLAMPLAACFKITFIIFWLLAFNSATHDIAADGFYIIGLDEHRQVWFCGIRNTFYRFGMIAGQGILVMLAGYLEGITGLKELNIKINAVPSSSIIQNADILPSSILNFSISQQNNEEEVKLVANSQEINIPIQLIPSSLKEKFANFAKEYNSGKNPQPPSFEDNPVEHERNISKKETGAFAILSIGLSKKPKEGKKIVLTFGRESGSKNLSLVEGARKEFSSDNWDRPLLAIVEIDSRAKNPCSAVFTARAGNITLSWMISFLALAGIYSAIAVYHLFILPHPAADISMCESRKEESLRFLKEFKNSFVSFFKRKEIIPCLAFLLLYRLGESQLVKLASPFLLDSQENGGLALSTAEVGFVYGTVGITALVIGGICGSFLAAKFGLKKCIWPMALAINLPDLVYVYLASFQPDNLFLVSLCVAIEQFGYGIGFTGYMLYMVYFVENSPYKSSHYAIMTGFMALGMMLPGMISGYIQQALGYKNFFWWVIVSTIPGFISLAWLKIDPLFGMKKRG